MSTYYLQTEDNSVQYLETYETIKENEHEFRFLRQYPGTNILYS